MCSIISDCGCILCVLNVVRLVLGTMSGLVSVIILLGSLVHGVRPTTTWMLQFVVNWTVFVIPLMGALSRASSRLVSFRPPTGLRVCEVICLPVFGTMTTVPACELATIRVRLAGVLGTWLMHSPTLRVHSWPRDVWFVLLLLMVLITTILVFRCWVVTVRPVFPLFVNCDRDLFMVPLLGVGQLVMCILRLMPTDLRMTIWFTARSLSASAASVRFLSNYELFYIWVDLVMG